MQVQGGALLRCNASAWRALAAMLPLTATVFCCLQTWTLTPGTLARCGVHCTQSAASPTLVCLRFHTFRSKRMILKYVDISTPPPPHHVMTGVPHMLGLNIPCLCVACGVWVQHPRTFVHRRCSTGELKAWMTLSQVKQAHQNIAFLNPKKPKPTRGSPSPTTGGHIEDGKK